MKNKVSGGDKTCECSRGNESGEHVVTGERSVCVLGGGDRENERGFGRTRVGERGGGACYHRDKRERWTERMREDSRG